MCRLFGFRSSVLSGVHASLVAAENALVQQSARHPDGWGVAYYAARFPHLIRSDKQALGDGLFKEVSGVVATRTLVAHIRQATTGKVSVLNCHPFQHGPWCFAHNGQIAGFEQGNDVYRRVLELIDPRFRSYILGATDSEAIFHVFLSRLARRVDDIYHDGVQAQVVVDALRETCDAVLERVPALDAQSPHRFNFLVTNGSVMVACRFRRTLHISTYKDRCPERDDCSAFEPGRCEAASTDGIVKHMIVSSEPIAGANVWIELQDGEYVSVDYGMNLRRGRFASLSDTPSARLTIVA